MELLELFKMATDFASAGVNAPNWGTIILVLGALLVGMLQIQAQHQSPPPEPANITVVNGDNNFVNSPGTPGECELTTDTQRLSN